MNTGESGFWGQSYTIVQDSHARAVLMTKFVAMATGEAFVATHKVTLESTTLALADGIAKRLQDKGLKTVIQSEYATWLAVIATNSQGAPVALVTIYSEEDRGESIPTQTDSMASKVDSVIQPRVGLFEIHIGGDREIIRYLMAGIAEDYKSERFAQIKWWYDEGRGTTYRTAYIEKPNTAILPEFYPGIKDPEQYIQDYLESDSAVLLMAGAPGTGKTTFLRHMIYNHNLTASVVYDEHLMQKDIVFQSFLFSKEDDVLIIEDADVIITSREIENNKLMSRFLNISDGLIKLPNKKLIFTTNLSDFGKIDSALMRPGRCFDVMHTRELNMEEAKAAARAAGLPIPMESRDYSIAELFNQGQKVRRLRRAGFGT